MQWRVVSYRVLSRVVECSRVMSALHMSALHHHHMSALHNMSALHIALETHIALWCNCASRQLHQASCTFMFVFYTKKLPITMVAKKMPPGHRGRVNSRTQDRASTGL